MTEIQNEIKLTPVDRIVNEIYSTEESYVQCLSQCLEYYHKPFLTCEELDEKLRTQIFFSLPEIHTTSSAFLKEMEEHKIKGELTSQIGKIFKKFLPFFVVYKPFIGNNEICLNLLAQIEKSPVVVQFLEQCRVSIPGMNQQPLRSILIMPVQRIPRYVLLFKELIKHTSETDKQYQMLVDDLKEIEELAKICNAALSNTERMIKLMKIRDSLKGFNGELINSTRHFVKEGILMKQCRKTSKPRYFYLFNDMIVYGTES